MSRSSSGSLAGPSMSWDAARDLYARSQRSWSQTHQQLTSALRERTTSPLNAADLRQKDAEIQDLRRQLVAIQEDMTEYKQQLERAEVTIRQQQMTIRNQSKAIENPRPGRDFPTTPRHQPANHGTQLPTQSQVEGSAAYGAQEQQSHGQGYRLQPSPGTVPPVNPTTFPQQRPARSGAFLNPAAVEYAPLAPRTGTTKVTKSGLSDLHVPTPPERSSSQDRPESQISSLGLGFNPLSNSFDPFAALPNPAQRPRPDPISSPPVRAGSSVASPESFITNPYPETSIPPSAVVASVPPPVVDEAVIASKMKQVFSMAQQYAKNYVNVPSTAGDNALPPDLKAKLLEAATNTTAFGLMTDRTSRYLLVSKIIISWIIKHVLRFNTFSGLCMDIDQLINGIKATIYQDTDPKVRHLLLVNMANEIKKLSQKPGFAAYVDHLSEQRAAQLQRIVRPMMHHHHLPTGEWSQDLLALVREAFNLAKMMYSSPHEFNFNFHNHGQRFNHDEMIDIEPQMGHSSGGQSSNVRAVVRLGTTPLVKMRKHMAWGESREQIAVKAKVLVKRFYN